MAVRSRDLGTDNRHEEKRRSRIFCASIRTSVNYARSIHCLINKTISTFGPKTLHRERIQIIRHEYGKNSRIICHHYQLVRKSTRNPSHCRLFRDSTFPLLPTQEYLLRKTIGGSTIYYKLTPSYSICISRRPHLNTYYMSVSQANNKI